jgi:hypothetical protein
MKEPGEGRELIGFILGPASGAAVLGALLGLKSGFTANALTMTFGVLLFCVVPGTILFGLPVYYAIRKVRIPGPWWTVAFAIAISVAPSVIYAALGIPGGVQVSKQGLLIIHAILGLGAALCGGIAGAVFWIIVFKREWSARAQQT